MQAITTKFLPPTNHRPARIKADAGDGRKVIVSWPDRLNVPDAHRAAALNLIRLLGWDNYEYAQGFLPDGTGYAFVAVLTPTEG